MGRAVPAVSVGPFGAVTLALALALSGGVPWVGSAPVGGLHPERTATAGAVANFTAAINRLVQLLGLAGGGILALAWARVALSWFSNDVTKKIQAKDRARDALIGTLLFVAAVSGLIYALAHWVVTGS